MKKRRWKLSEDSFLNYLKNSEVRIFMDLAEYVTGIRNMGKFIWENPVKRGFGFVRDRRHCWTCSTVRDQRICKSVFKIPLHWRSQMPKFLAALFFFRQFLRSPCQIGSICPSGRFLTSAMADMALENSFSGGLIIDLGAGSGVVSQRLLARGVSPERILALDISDRFRNVFGENCPGVKLHIGDARDLAAVIDGYYPDLPVQAVISSLPLRIMPPAMIREIMLEIRNLLQEKGGVLIQYTYAFWLHSFLEFFGFTTAARKYCAFNLPPALVEKYIP